MTTPKTRCFSTAAPRESSLPSNPVGAKKAGPSSPQPHPSRIEFVDFWGTKLRGDDDDEDDPFSLPVPVDPSLDRHGGPLPPGAYQLHGKPEFDPKPNCRIALSLDWGQQHTRFQRFPLDGDQVVQQVQDCLDAGFQTFQLSSSQSKKYDGMEMIGRVFRETPKFVDMHWTARLELPPSPIISPRTVKEAVIDLLSATRMESLDTILVPYDPQILPQYHFEVLDVLHDMQRDGFLRSIGVEHWPASLIKQAQEYGFDIHMHQQSGNLLLPPPRSNAANVKDNRAALPAVAEWWTDPLAGNFLSDTVVTGRNPPVYAEGWKDVRKWHDRKQNRRNKKARSGSSSSTVRDLDVWKVFQKEVHDQLRELSRKHEVSIAAIALRWCLQEKMPANRGDRENNIIAPSPASSVIYPLLLVEEPEGQLAQQLRDLRDVFRFALDEEDLAVLEEMVARPKPKAKKLRIDDVDVPIGDIPIEFLKEFQALSASQNENDFMMGKDANDDDDHDDDEMEDYPKIDFNNPTLWL